MIADRVQALDGPFPILETDIGALNLIFSDAFTERYRRDGLVGVRVPPLNPAIWRYAIEGAAAGAMLWRDGQGRIAAFNLAHHSGVEGWMGPLAVREDLQGEGRGKTIVNAAIAHLQASRCRVIGLETMPRTMDNIGFYASLGFVPSRLTVTLTLDARPAPRAPRLLSSLSPSARDDAIGACRDLLAKARPGYDYSREIGITHEHALGDTLLLFDGDELAAFAICHSAPLVDSRARDELRVLKLVARDEAMIDNIATQLADLARRTATQRAAIRLEGEYGGAFRRLVRLGARVRWTDLRMTLAGFEESPPLSGVALSNWEI